MELGVTTTVSGLNPDEGDLALTDTNQEVVYTTLAAEVAQRLKVRLNFFRGEWFLNLDAGTPYYQAILTKGPSDAIIRSVFGQVITTTPGVHSLISLSYTVARATRSLSLTFKARLEDGTTFVSTNYPAFVVLQ